MILTPDGSIEHNPHSLSLETLTFKQRLYLNSSLIDIDNKKNKFLSSFDSFNCKFSSENHLINPYSDRFFFHLQELNIKNHIKNLDNITLKVFNDSFLSIVIFDVSIKNHVVTSISHIHMHNKPIIKMIHCVINVTSTEAELFTIYYSTNQAVGFSQVKKIIIITDLLHAAKIIFDSLMHPYQIHSTAISYKLREFFIRNNNNYIEFWDCSSKLNWPLYLQVNKDTKSFISLPNFPSKFS